MSPIIGLLTDFGTTDIYAGVMKGVIAQICPEAYCIDITHAIQPHNVRQAAFVLLDAYHYFSAGTIFLIVVDPGVGSTRRPIVAQAGGYTFVAPDNGVLTYILSEYTNYKVVELSNREYHLHNVSSTFHGRDVFAPVSAHIASGVPVEKLGPRLETLFALPFPSLEASEQRVVGEVMHIDQFGNIITSIGNLRWVEADKLSLYPRFGRQRDKIVPLYASEVTVLFHDMIIYSILPTYSETARGSLLSLVGSSGYLEIAINQGSAAARLDARIGDRVELNLRSSA